MLRVLHPFLCLMLGLAIALSGAMAMPVAGHDGGMEAVICGEDGAQTVWLDASGAVVPPGQHDCDDCPKCAAMRADAGWVPPLAAAVRMMPGAGKALPVAALPLLPRSFLRPVPRGPPLAAGSATRPIAACVALPPAGPEGLEFGQVTLGRFVQVPGRPIEDARE